MRKLGLLLSFLLTTTWSIGLHAQCADNTTDPTPGDFINNQWTVYAYNLVPVGSSDAAFDQRDYNDYRGYYIDVGYGTGNLSFDSRQSFAANQSPSNVTGYTGCNVTSNNHMVSYKRKGFPNDTYTLSIASAPGQASGQAHDDNVWIIIDGIVVFQHDGCCDTHANVWTGNLDANSEVEYVWIERPGNSYGALQVEPVSNPSLTYGTDEWHVSVYSDKAFSVLEGYYTETNLSFDTADRWTDNNTPSNANATSGAPYSGDPVSNDNHSYTYAREGFPCGIYQIDITRHDDDVRLIVDGELVYSSNSWDNRNGVPNVWQGYLGTNSKISFSIVEDAGESRGALSFVPIAVPSSGNNIVIWTGAIDSDVANAGNWCVDDPSSVTEPELHIPANVPNFPNFNVNFNAKDINIYSGANMSITNTLTLSGNVNNEGGIINSESGQLNFNDAGNAAAQNINGAGFEIGSINLAGDLNLSTTTPIRLLNNMTFTNTANLATNDNLVLACRFNDAANRVAQIGELVNGSSITGNVVTEQCISARRAFRLVSSPVTTTTSIHDNWQEGANAWTNDPNPGYGTHITGTNSDQTNGFDLTPSANPSLFLFNNTSQQWSAIDNTDINTLSAGEPLRLMVRGDRSTNIKSNAAAPSNTILRATGTILSGDVLYNTQFNQNADAFNFFGNPYPAAVDMGMVLNDAATTNLKQDYIVWDAQMGVRGAFVSIDMDDGSAIDGATGSAANQFLQPGQAAFVVTQTTGVTPTMMFKEAYKNINQAQTAVFSTGNNIPSLTLQLYTQNQFLNQEKPSDAIRIKWDSQFSNAYAGEDLPKFGNLDENLAVVNGQAYTSIDRRSMPQTGETIPLFVNQYRENQYSLQFTFESLPGLNLYLVDQYKNKEILVSKNDQVYNFSVDQSLPGSIAQDRFYFKWGSQLGIGEETAGLYQIYPVPAQNLLNLQLDPGKNQARQVQVYNMLGQKLIQQTIDNKQSTYVVDLSKLQTGNYVLVLIDASGQNLYREQFIKN